MKRFFAFALTLAMAFSLVACGSGKTETTTPATSEQNAPAETPAAPASVTTMKFNTVQSAADPKVEWYNSWMDAMAEASNGEIDFQLYLSNGLGNSEDVLEMAAMGQPVIQDCDFSYLANYVPDFAIAMSPYLFNSPEQIEKFWQSDVGQDLCRQLEAKGLHILNIHYFGTRNVICDTKVESRDDFSKLKLRCAATPMWNEVVRVLGATAVNTPWSETYQALSQGVANGAESPMGLLYSSKLYEPCKYLIRTEHLVAATTVVMSQAVYESLSDDAKKALDEVGLSFSETVIPLQKAVEVEYEQKLVEEGVEIIEIDKTPFIEEAKTTPAQPAFAEWTPGMYEKVLAAIS